MTHALTPKDINSISLNGKRISTTRTEDFVILEVENYQSKEPVSIPVHIPYTVWEEEFKHQEYFEINGHLTSTEVAAHDFEYRFIADEVYPSDSLTTKYLKPKNELNCIAYLAQPPRELTDVHPYITILYLGTGSGLENGNFSGDRFQFDLSLLRKNTDMAKNLTTGDIIKLKATISTSDAHGIQFIGKQLVTLFKSEANKQNSDGLNAIGDTFMMTFDTCKEPV